jgi:hypothetical protein
MLKSICNNCNVFHWHACNQIKFVTNFATTLMGGPLHAGDAYWCAVPKRDEKKMVDTTLFSISRVISQELLDSLHVGSAHLQPNRSISEKQKTHRDPKTHALNAGNL